MANTAFTPGQILSATDLNIFLTNAAGQRQDAATISYALFQIVNNVEVLVGAPSRTPEHPEVGSYWASFVIPPGAPLSLYHIRWTFQQTVSSTPIQVVQEFTIVSSDTVITSQSLYSQQKFSLMTSMRVNLRDNNPDRNYHFRPPTGEGPLTKQTRVFGFIWEDIEMAEYIERGIDMVNLAAPLTGFIVDTVPRPWWTVTIHAGMLHALRALAINWVEEEFDYSIGGISLGIAKAEKYESLLNSMEDEFTNELVRAKETIKIHDGLQQPRFGIGIRSSFGPYCFSQGSVIPTKNGLFQIENLIGKKFRILSSDKNGSHWKEGTAYLGPVKRIIEIIIDGLPYRTSFDHPYMMSDRTYVRAENLRFGNLIKKIELPGRVDSIKDLGDEQTYDIEVKCNSAENFSEDDGHNLAMSAHGIFLENYASSCIYSHNSGRGVLTPRKFVSF